jgi:geranylgeranyl diphosphate synthase type II
MTLDQYIAEQQRRVDAALRHWVPPETEEPSTIHKAMRYSLFAGGKRIRPLLAMAAGGGGGVGCSAGD